MSRILAHLLLSLALIFQGMGSACAAVRMEPAGHGGMSSDMTMQHCAHEKACPGCKGKPTANKDCMQLCSMPASLFVLRFVVPPQLAPARMPMPAVVSLVERVEVPPTPPPIA